MGRKPFADQKLRMQRNKRGTVTGKIQKKERG